MRCDGAEVARLRRELGITQLDLADKAKVSKTTIERIERGIAVDYQSIHQIAPVLGVGFNDLIRPEGGDTAGPEAAFVPLRSLGSARELMDLLLRCDTAAVDLVDDPVPISPTSPGPSSPTTASVSPCCVWRSVAAPR